MNVLNRPLRRIALHCAVLLGFGLAGLTAKPKLIIETDIGGDKDDQASFVRLLLHSNEFDIKAIICDRPAGQLNDGAGWNPSPGTILTGVDMANYYINAYGQVVNNLHLHDSNYPTASTLLGLVVAGYPGVNNGRDRIISIVDNLATGDVVYYSNWGSLTRDGNGFVTSSLKRAFDKILTDRGTSGLNAFVSKIRQVSLDGDGDIRSGHTSVVRAQSFHVETGFPADSNGSRWYHRFQPITATAGGFSMSSDVSDTHGPLAPLYRGAGQKEGDSWSTLYVLPIGVNDLEQPTWGGPGGRYTPRNGGPSSVQGVPFYWSNGTDNWNGTTNRDNTAARFAAAVQNAFRARWDWCYMNFASANHDPIPTVTINGGNAVTMGVRRLSLPASSTVNLAATVVDPDAGDTHTYAWTYYREAGTYTGNISITGATSANATFFIPSDAAGKQIHVYVAVTDNGSRKGNRVPDLTRFCRVVIDVTSGTASVPTFTTHPASQTVNAGQSVTFTANANGTPAPGYQWRKNGVNISGATSSSYTISSVTTGDAGNYTVVATNSVGSATSNTAVLTVNTSSVPAAPTNLSVSSASATSLLLTWTDNSSNETGFTIERKVVTSGGSTPTVTLVGYAGNKTAPTIEAANSAQSFKVGALQANDRTDTWTSVPSALSGAVRLFTARLDRQSTPAGSIYTVNLSGSGKIYAVLDGRYGANGKPTWMGSEWTNSGLTATTTEAAPGTWRLWERTASAGNITLGVDTAQYSGITYVFTGTGGGSSETWQAVATVGANVTSYTHTGLTTGTTYTYRVRANGSSGNSSWSAEASGVPSASTENWTGQDIGSPTPAGSSSYNSSTDTFTIQAGGNDIFNTSDQFRYVTLDGGMQADGEIIVRVASITNTNNWAKAGVMMRDGLAGNARNVAVLVSPNNQASFQYRSGAGGSTATTTVANLGAPRWLRLVRSGNTFTGYHSANGTSWTQIGTVNISLPSNLQVGLSVTSHNTSALTTAVIDNVDVTP